MFTAATLREVWVNAWPVICVLLFASVLSFSIMLERWSYLRRLDFDRESLMGRLRELLLARKREGASAYCDTIRAPIGKVLKAIVSTAPIGPEGRDAQNRMAQRLIRAESGRMLRGITTLGTIGSITPFVGLLGTVVGIIHAFRAIAESAGGGPSIIANGIAEALIATAMGLFVAIPAVIGYNFLSRRAERITEDMELAADETIDLNARA